MQINTKDLDKCEMERTSIDQSVDKISFIWGWFYTMGGIFILISVIALFAHLFAKNGLKRFEKKIIFCMAANYALLTFLNFETYIKQDQSVL